MRAFNTWWRSILRAMVRDRRQDIYQGKNGQRIKSIDDTILRLEEIIFNRYLDGTGDKAFFTQSRAQINALGAERDLLVKDSFKE